MAVIFSGKWTPNSETFGINFEVHQGDKKIVCVIYPEALQDIQPDNATDTAEQQFLANRFSFQAIAEELIEAGEHADGFLHIHSRHVAA